MIIDFHYDTSKMSKEERLKVRSEIQQALDQLNHELNTASKASHLHFEDDITDTFFGKRFYLKKMSKEELDSTQDEARLLLKNITMWIDNLPVKDSSPKKVFFGVEFNFAKMSREKLMLAKEDCRCLLTEIHLQSSLLDKADRSAKDPTAV